VSSLNDNSRLTGKKYWRSLDELAGTPEFKEWLHREFPQGASEWDNSWSRRSFLTLMGASMALAGLAGCRRPVEKIVPYVHAPEEVMPGIPLHYATTMPFGASNYGVVVESHEGRPTKIEGNKQHPSSRGKTNSQMQAAILDMYDPDRAPYILNKGAQSDWAKFVTWWQEQYLALEKTGGKGLAVLSEPFASPTMARFRRDFLKKFPKARWIAWEPINDENIYGGVRLATGRDYQPVHHYDKARVVLSLDSDFLMSESEAVAASLGFADGRRMKEPTDDMNRLYVVEPLMTLTGGMADHRLRLRSREVGAFALALAGELQKQGLKIDALRNVTIPAAPGESEKWLQPLAKDLLRAKGQSVIVAGRRQPANVHAVVLAVNEALGNLGTTVGLADTPDTLRSSTDDFEELVGGMKGGRVEYLFVIGGNPSYDAPVDFDFHAAMKKVPHTIRVGLHPDETGRNVEWNINRAHFLESWGDARAVDGTLSVTQPMIEPLYGGKSDVEMAALLATGRDLRGYDVVRETWGGFVKGNFEDNWKKILHDGAMGNSALEAKKPGIDTNRVADTATRLNIKNDHDLELIFHPCYKVYDGRQANNGWMQELPDPITKISWDNVATMSVATARDLGVKKGDLIRLQVDNREVTMPAWIVPGQAHKTIGVALGYGRMKAGRVGDNVGVDCYALRTAAMPLVAYDLKVSATGETYELADAQHHGSMEGRPIIREATLAEYREDPEFAKEMVEHPPLRSPWTEPDYTKGYQWGMSIDLTTCTGCNACTIACQAENNIPIVGKTQVGKGREMHWIRVDRYYEGDIDKPAMLHQAMPCQQCENAPCEQVCPVAATVHDKEGLNVMVYNRCIGTRYCSNNCPYKVRRFNFFNYTNNYPDTIKMAQNPDVTVRSRGVMEKCSYCVQRINRGKKAAKLENRTVRDGEVVSACQQACPADAIVFGNINDPESRVTKIKKQARDYALLAELNTKPRTTYLAKIRNPNPDLEPPVAKPAGEHAEDS